MPTLTYSLRSKVQVWTGKGAWHFVRVSAGKSKQIRMMHSDLTAGFGSIPVRVTCGDTTWKTSIFPESKNGTYLLFLKKAVREAEGITTGKTISFTLDIGM